MRLWPFPLFPISRFPLFSQRLVTCYYRVKNRDRLRLEDRL